MDYETRLLEEKQGGKEEATISGLKKLISALRDFGGTNQPLRDFGGTNQQILHRLEADYGDQFTKKELENFMKQA